LEQLAIDYSLGCSGKLLDCQLGDLQRARPMLF
jgi:hypothetical protein